MRLLLLRHAHCASCGPVLAGRTPGIELDETGRQQAAALARSLLDERIAAIYTSPLPRAYQTAEALAQAHGLTPVVRDAWLEMDFGEWTGATFAELEQDPGWRRFNRERGSVRAPGGESAAELQVRAVGELRQLAERHADDTVAVVTHAELVRVVLTHALRMSLDDCLRIDVAPASVTRLAWYGDWIGVLGVNSVWEAR